MRVSRVMRAKYYKRTKRGLVSCRRISPYTWLQDYWFGKKVSIRDGRKSDWAFLIPREASMIAALPTPHGRPKRHRDQPLTFAYRTKLRGTGRSPKADTVL